MKDSVGKSVLKYTGIFAAVLAVAVLVRTYVVNFALVPTGSMAPTIQTDDVIVISRFAYLTKPVSRFDVVVFRSTPGIDEGRQEKEKGTPLVKRVIGIPGDKVQLIRGNLYVNGQLVLEEYLYAPGIDTTEEYDVPADSYFLLGDHRSTSYDSRYWSDPFLPRQQIIGKVAASFGWVR